MTTAAYAERIRATLNAIESHGDVDDGLVLSKLHKAFIELRDVEWRLGALAFAEAAQTERKAREEGEVGRK